MEWVYNSPDIDHAGVVFARDMGREKNEELIRHLSGRKVWVVEPDAQPIQFNPYPRSGKVSLPAAVKPVAVRPVAVRPVAGRPVAVAQAAGCVR